MNNSYSLIYVCNEGDGFVLCREGVVVLLVEQNANVGIARQEQSVLVHNGAPAITLRKSRWFAVHKKDHNLLSGCYLTIIMGIARKTNNNVFHG